MSPRLAMISPLFLLLATCQAPAPSTPPATLPARANRPIPNVNLTLSHDTTRITQPLHADGTPDYIAALEAPWSQGVTPENNAAGVILALSRNMSEDPSYIPIFEKRLGYKLPATPALDDLETFIQYNLSNIIEDDKTDAIATAGVSRDDAATKVGMLTRRQPWTPAQFPAIAKWLENNAPAIDALVEATRRSHFYMPFAIKDVEVPMLMVPLHPSKCYRAYATILSTRAMLRVGQGDVAGALEDVRALYRLGHLIGSVPTVIGRLIHISVLSVAENSRRAVATSGKLDQAALRALLDDKDFVAAITPVRDAFDTHERFAGLATIAFCARFGLLCRSADHADPVEWQTDFEWDPPLKYVNDYFDRTVAIGQLSAMQRSAALAAFQNDQARTERGGTGLPRWSEDLVNMLTPSIGRAMVIEDRLHAEIALTRLAIALQIHRLKTGKFPETLEALSPVFLKVLPVDPFSEKLPIYRPNANGYLLYSIGDNGKDDNGVRDYKIKADDISFSFKE